MHGGCLDQGRDLVEQSIPCDELRTACPFVELADDPRAAPGKRGEHLALIMQRRLVVIRLPDPDRSAGQDAMSQRPVRALDVHYLAGNGALAVHHDEPVHRTHELAVADAPAHNLWYRQLVQG